MLAAVIAATPLPLMFSDAAAFIFDTFLFHAGCRHIFAD